MIESFVQYLNELTKSINCEIVKGEKDVVVNFNSSNANQENFTIKLNLSTQMLSLRKGNYLIDEIKVYNDTLSGEQSLNIALKRLIDFTDN